jgi:hypothetical protein
MNYYNIILIFLNIICTNAFILTHNVRLNNKAKLYKNKRSALLMSNISDSYSTSNNDNDNDNDNDTYSNSKSFYEFIKQHNITLNVIIEETHNKKNNIDENYVENYITNFVDNYYKNNSQTETHKLLTSYSSYEKYIRESTSKDLKLLTSEASIEWAKTWTLDMIHQPNHFPTFMFQDMFKMRDFGSINSSRTYFYIGFFPKTLNLKQGPYYVGAFELQPDKRHFITHAIIQNPYYYSNNNFDTTKFVEFKRELLALCRDADVFLQFSNLKNTKDERYYFSWLYDNI